MTAGAEPVLVVVAHGTRSAPGQEQIRVLAADVARRRPHVDVRAAFVDVQQPRLGDLAPRLGRRAVVVPLLLSSGYHVRVDIADAVAGIDAVATDPVGPDPRLVDLLAARITAAGPTDAVVLAAAGSSDPRSRADGDAVARALPMPVHVGYAATSEPRAADVVARLRAAGARRITIAAYLLAEGLFHRSLHRCGATAVTAPLVTDPVVTGLVLHRYDTAVAGLSAGAHRGPPPGAAEGR